MRPKEDPKDKAARERERRITDVERQSATQDAAGSLASELIATYGRLPKGMSPAPAPISVKPRVPAPRPPSGNR